MLNFLGGGGKASSVADITRQLADPTNKTVGDIFNHLEGTWGDKVLMNQNGGAKSFIAKQVYTQTKKVLIKAGFTTTTTSVIGGKLVALAPVLGAMGIALIGAGAVVGISTAKAVILAGSLGVASVVEKLARGFLDDGKLSIDEINDAFNTVDKKANK